MVKFSSIDSYFRTSVTLLSATLISGALASSCAPRPGEIVATPTDVEARAFLNDLTIGEGDAVLIERTTCDAADRQGARGCETTQVGKGEVIRIDTIDGRHGVIRVAPGTELRSGDRIVKVEK